MYSGKTSATHWLGLNCMLQFVDVVVYAKQVSDESILAMAEGVAGGLPVQCFTDACRRTILCPKQLSLLSASYFSTG